MHYTFIRMALPMMLLTAPAVWAADADPAAGKIAFNKCVTCHAVLPGQNKTGPTLHGVVGRKAASVQAFSYSPAMQKHDVTWTSEELDKYLTNPKGTVPGTKMVFPGLRNEAERKNIIAYLEALK